MKVSLFLTCLAEQALPEVGMAAARVLERQGCQVDFPEAQACCGQPAFNAGFWPDARGPALALMDAFESSPYVVSPSGSCAGMIRHYLPKLFESDPALKARAERLASVTYEFSEFLVKVLGKPDIGGRFAGKATFHPSCHASRLLGVKDEPLALLSKVQGLELLPLTRAEDCCGFGGAFCVKLDELSAAMAGEKADHVAESGAELLVSTDLGCLMNISGLMSRQGRPVRALHLAQLLDEATR